jgi:integrase
MQYKMTKHLHSVLNKRFYDLIMKDEIPSGYVFKSPKTGTKFVDLRKPWKRLLKKANLPHCRIHDIRHLVATYSINHLEIPIEKVSHTLGHTSIEVTQKYITANPETAKDVIESLIDSVIKN